MAACQSTTPLAYPVHGAQGALLGPVGFPGQAADASTSEVRAVFGEWTAARAQGNAAAYDALYDPARFEGVRRNASGIEKRLTWAEWKAEQRSASERADGPRVLRPVFESWSGGTLDAATASVSFDEETATGRGQAPQVVQRVLVFGRGSDGKLRIMREELGSAGRGAQASANSLSRDAKVARAMERKEPSP